MASLDFKLPSWNLNSFSVGGDEEGIFSKADTENLCLCLRWKLNKT